MKLAFYACTTVYLVIQMCLQIAKIYMDRKTYVRSVEAEGRWRRMEINVEKKAW